MYFVIGMRRSGTSIFREIVQSHPDVASCLFEPHDLWAAVDLAHFSRFKNLEWVNSTIDKFNRANIGAKFALNSGTKALEWIWLDKTFNKPNFLFIRRCEEDTWNSVYKQDKDSVRGIVSHKEHRLTHERIYDQFARFCVRNPDRACMIDFEDLVKKPDQTMKTVWKTLKVKDHSIKHMIRKPENRRGL